MSGCQRLLFLVSMFTRDRVSIAKRDKFSMSKRDKVSNDKGDKVSIITFYMMETSKLKQISPCLHQNNPSMETLFPATLHFLDDGDKLYEIF